MPPKVPAQAEKSDPAVEIVPSEKTPQPEKKEIEIDVQTGKPIEQAPSGPSVTEELRKLEARLEYQRRQDRKELLEAIGRTQTVQQPPARPAEKPEPQEDFDPEIDAIAKVNYQKAINQMAAKKAEEIAEKKFKSMMEERDKAQQEFMTKQQAATRLEREKTWVLGKTPELNDESSEEFKGYYNTYNQMLSEDPSLSSNPVAPRLVWHEWRAGAAQSAEANKETERLKRVAAGAVPQARSLGAPKTIKLTQDELDMCKDKGISPAVYAQMKDANFKEGVSA